MDFLASSQPLDNRLGLIVDERGAVVPAVAGTVVGRRISGPVRMVWALPVPGVELVPAFATEKSLALLGDSSATVVATRRVYVSRMVWAAPS